MPSKPDDRARTIKKIDEIEAQMSMQWWKTKHGATSSLQSIDSSGSQMGVTVPSGLESRAAPVRAAAFHDLLAGYGVTEPMGLQPLRPLNSPSPGTDRFLIPQVEMLKA